MNEYRPAQSQKLVANPHFLEGAMAQKPFSNIILIGMPGAGKSTIGVILAKQSAKDFIDTDVLIQLQEKRSLQDILDAEGYLALRQIEEQVLLDLHCQQHVISTGGSAVYSAAAMRHLKKAGVAVFLEVPLAEIQKRLIDMQTRGIAQSPGQTFEALYEERQCLYQQYADLTIDCDNRAQEEISMLICQKLNLC